jgi:hypothetical protein
MDGGPLAACSKRVLGMLPLRIADFSGMGVHTGHLTLRSCKSIQPSRHGHVKMRTEESRSHC